VKLSWHANTEFDVVRYEVYVGLSPNSMSKFMDVQQQTSLMILLSSGGTWYVSVTAIDAYGLESTLVTPVKVRVRS